MVQSFEDHVRWMYEHRPDEVFTARNSEVIQDPKSRMCYRKFFVNIGKNKYATFIILVINFKIILTITLDRNDILKRNFIK